MLSSLEHYRFQSGQKPVIMKLSYLMCACAPVLSSAAEAFKPSNNFSVTVSSLL